MNIIEQYRDWRDNRRLKRLEADLNKLNNNELHFNPRYLQEYTEYNQQQEFSRNVAENHAWFSGSGLRLRRFYITYPDYVNVMSYFWQKAPLNYRKVHSGVPGNISKKMSTILFGGGLTTDIKIYADTENENEDESTTAQDILETLKDKTQFEEKLNEAATTESWCGHVFVKLSYDVSITPYPIIEVVDVRNANIVKERGITTAIEFLKYYKKSNITYVHKEVYTTDEYNNAVIENRLYTRTMNGNKEVELTKIEETADLEPEYVFDGIKGMLAFEKPNKLPNAEFSECGYGESDYAGATSAFDALDETISEIFSEIRNNKTIRYIPKSMIDLVERTDSDGITRQVAETDAFVTNYQKLNDSLSEQQKNEINITQIADKTLQHVEKWKVALSLAINKAGLSPIALGITGLEGIQSGAESQRERNKVTLETRSAKMQLWRPFLENFIKQLFILNEWIRANGLQGDNAISDKKITTDRIKTSVTFGDYITDTKADRITIWSGAKLAKVASTDEAVREIHKDWDEEDIQDEINKIKFEEGMSFDTPENLPELTGEADNETDRE